jgi:hypothetical protein
VSKLMNVLFSKEIARYLCKWNKFMKFSLKPS